MYKFLVRPLLFQLDSESAHHFAMSAAKVLRFPPAAALMKAASYCDDTALEIDVFGLKFKNPIGLAAGFDKDCSAFDLFSSIGFGAVEFGTVTAEPQTGNPRPRIFRFPSESALINRMGFPSCGADIMAKRLKLLQNRSDGMRIGVNIGKTKIVPIDDALNDYVKSFQKLCLLGDYFVLNISSPNTPELRALQERSRLEALLAALRNENKLNRPILVKIAPDLSFAEIDDILDCAFRFGIAGIIATNTTISRNEFRVQTDETGGLSGRPLFRRAREVVAYISRQTQKKIPIIGVGGIFSGSDALSMIQAGASLVQIYSALIYEGPFLIKRVKRELKNLLEKHGASSVREMVASENNT